MNKIKTIFILFFCAVFMAACSSSAHEIISVETTQILSPEETCPSPSSTSNSGEKEASVEKSASCEEEICTSIVGAVVNPGVYYMSPKSRVYELINLAGGLCDDADITGINLVFTLSDGMQVTIPYKDSATDFESPSSSFIQGAESSGLEGCDVSLTDSVTKVNINTADLSLLMTLTGIGKTRAEAIIEYRNAHGAFSSIEDIMNVSGIKEATFDKIKDEITVR